MPEKLDIDSLFEKPTQPVHQIRDEAFSEPIRQPNYSYPHQTARTSQSFGTFILVALVLFFAAMWLSQNWKGSDDRRQDENIVDVRVPGPVVLIAWDDEDRDKVSAGQSQVLSTTLIQTHCEESGIDYRRYDVDDDLSRVEPYFQTLMDSASDPPSITIATPTSASSYKLPDDVQDTIKLIDSETR